MCAVQLGPGDRYLVLCSDGVFEFMSNEEIIAAVHMLAKRGHKASDIANFLVRHSLTPSLLCRDPQVHGHVR